MIYKGEKELDTLHIGTKEIERVLLGEDLIWENFKYFLLGTGTSINITSIYPDYANLTAGNFFIKSTSGNPTFSASIVASQYGPRLGGASSLEKSYNQSTGVISSNFWASGDSYDRRAVTLVLIPDLQKQIDSGKVVHLGSGRSFSLKNITDNWENLTNDNFLISSVSYANMNQRYYEGGAYTCAGYGQLGYSYNQSNGVLSAYHNLIFTNNGGGWLSSVYTNADMYYVRKPIV